jgi:membrane-associated protease RseP (regulator of RpoE activity)
MARATLLLLCLASALAATAAAAHPHAHEGRGRLGLQVQPLTPELRAHLGAPEDAGVLVARVEPDSPAAAAGVRVGDVVTAAGGEPVAEPRDLIARVAGVPEGETLLLELVRAGKPVPALEVTPRGAPGGPHAGLERWLPGGFHQGMESLEERIDAIERRLQELERRLPAEKAT